MTPSGSLVVRAGAEDADRLRDIRLEALRDTPEAYGTTFEEMSQWTRDQWAQAAATRVYYLGSLEGQLAGMASGGGHDRHPGTHWLFGMYVSPWARGTGLADALVEAVIDWARAEGATELFLHVNEALPRARALYEKIGFEVTGDGFAMQRDPSLALVTMVKELRD